MSSTRFDEAIVPHGNGDSDWILASVGGHLRSRIHDVYEPRLRSSVRLQLKLHASSARSSACDLRPSGPGPAALRS